MQRTGWRHLMSYSHMMGTWRIRVVDVMTDDVVCPHHHFRSRGSTAWTFGNLAKVLCFKMKTYQCGCSHPGWRQGEPLTTWRDVWKTVFGFCHIIAGTIQMFAKTRSSKTTVIGWDTCQSKKDAMKLFLFLSITAEIVKISFIFWTDVCCLLQSLNSSVTFRLMY